MCASSYCDILPIAPPKDESFLGRNVCCSSSLRCFASVSNVCDRGRCLGLLMLLVGGDNIAAAALGFLSLFGISFLGRNSCPSPLLCFSSISKV